LANVIMKIADRYHRFVRWSEEDQLYIGYCPDLYFGGVCHGEKEAAVYPKFRRFRRNLTIFAL